MLGFQIPTVVCFWDLCSILIETVRKTTNCFFFQAEEISKYVRELLGYCGLSFSTLKNYYHKGGAFLVDELSEAFSDKADLVPPGTGSFIMTSHKLWVY